jgi:excisionase family DNA binding protein
MNRSPITLTVMIDTTESKDYLSRVITEFISSTQGMDLKTVIKEAILETHQPGRKATLTIAECAAYTGIGRDKILELVHNDKSDFPCFRVGAKFLIDAHLLDKWIDKISMEKRIL